MSTTNQKRSKPHTHREHGAEQRRLQRQAEAEARKAARAERTPQQQITLLMERGVTSGREWNRLHNKIRDLHVSQTVAGQKKVAKKKGAKAHA